MSQSSFKRTSGRGFTLIELLVVIVVIGILIGILIPVLGPMVVRAQNAAVQSEVQQLESAMEQFKTKYGFYPPDFSTINSGDDMKPYIRKISQNHEHIDQHFDDWWDVIGQHIKDHQGAEIVFWLSGLRKSAQYPLFNPDPLQAPSFGLPVAAFPDSMDPDREVFFEFESRRLFFDPHTDEKVASYIQPKFEVEPFVYFNSNTYASSTAIVHPYVDPSNGLYFNLKTFQIVAAGRDESFFDPNAVTPIKGDDPMWSTDKYHADNISNFAQGELKKVLGF